MVIDFHDSLWGGCILGHQVFKSTGFLILGVVLLCLIILTGITTGCNGEKGNSARSTDGGNLIWAKNAGQASGFGITALSDDSIVVTGSFQNLTVFGPGQSNQVTLNSDGIGFDTFIARYNPDGRLVWVKHNTGTGGDFSDAITTLSDNSTVVTGLFEETATFGKGEQNETILTSAGARDFFIARYNPDGTLVWAKQAGAESNADGWKITALSDDSVVVTGWFAESAIFSPGEPNQTQLDCAGYRDMFVARFNPDGSLVWAKRAGGISPDEGHGITSLSDNSIVITGHFIGSSTFGMEEFNQTALTSAGESDLFIARYNQDGTLTWAKSAGGPKWDECWDVTALSDDSTVVTGFFEDSGTFGAGESNQTTLISNGIWDAFIARYNPDGTIAWAKQAGGSGRFDCGIGITVLTDDSTVVTGYFKGKATFGQHEANRTILKSGGNNDMFNAKYNPNGTLAWAKQAGRSKNGVTGNAITSLSDNSIVVVGEFKESAVFGQGETNETELFSAKISDMFLARFAP
jgi:uncharacterized delta-60 repeat protein